MPRIYKVNDKIGRLTLLEKTAERKSGFVVWICECECGNILKKSTSYLCSKLTSLQCNDCSITSQKLKMETHGGISIKYARLYGIGRGAQRRCKPNGPKDYGKRGIKFEFTSIEHFINWSLENGYSAGLTIERNDVNGNYSPENCSWIPLSEQGKNKTTTPELHGHKGYKDIGLSLGISEKAIEALVYKKKMTLDEIYQASINDPMFYMSLYEKTSYKALRRKSEWKLKKEDIENIINSLNDGETIAKQARDYKVDHATVKKALQRYKNGLYN